MPNKINPLESHNAALTITGNIPSFGFNLFWTVNKGIWSQDDINAWGKDLPVVMKEALIPNDLISSFERATNLEGTRKVPTVALSTENPEQKFFFTSRKITSTERILIREVLDTSGKRASILNLGTVKLDTDTNTVSFESTWQNTPQDRQFTADDITNLSKQLGDLLDTISNQVDARSSGVEDQKIRTAVAKWVNHRHGASLRGHGGVYFIPHRQKDTFRQMLIGEIKAIQTFLSDNGLGRIFAFELIETDTFNQDDMVAALLEDINSELDPLLQDIEENPDPKNRKLSSQIGQVTELREKVKSLNETFSQRFTHIGIKLGVAAKALQNKMSTSDSTL